VFAAAEEGAIAAFWI